MSAEAEPTSNDAQTPSVLAARQAGARTRRDDHARAYPLIALSEDPAAIRVELAATQALLRAESAVEVGSIVATLVHDLGGALVPARYADPLTAVPVDVSLGMADPLLPFADPLSIAAMRLSAVLPEFLDTARFVVSRLHCDIRRDDEAVRDPLTALLTRRAWMRRLSLAVPGDAVCLIDLDDFKSVNDTGGHAAGDAVLRAIGSLVNRTFRLDDSCGRYGGDELVCLAPGLSASDLAARCEWMRVAWEQECPLIGATVGRSIGVADVGEPGGLAALLAADTAMYRAKSDSRNRTVVAPSEDHGHAAT